MYREPWFRILSVSEDRGRSMADIAAEVSQRCGVSLQQIRNNNRYITSYISARKMVARAISEQRPDLSSGEIAGFLRVDPSSVRRYLREHKRRVRAKPVHFDTPEYLSRHATIIHQVAREHNLLPRDVLSRSRAQHIVDARFKAIARVYEEIKVDGKPPSLNLLGAWFNRDHTSILNALTKTGHKPPKGQRVAK